MACARPPSRTRVTSQPLRCASATLSLAERPYPQATAERRDHLSHSTADPAAGGVHQHPLARPEPGDVLEEEQRRGQHQRYRGRGGQWHFAGQRGNQHGVSQGNFGQAAATGERHDPLPARQTRDAAARFTDRSRDFETWHAGPRGGVTGVAPARHYVDEIDPGVADVDRHLADAGMGFRELTDLGAVRAR